MHRFTDQMLIADTATLEQFCASLADAPFLGVDTEFFREKTYFATLCLVQVAGPEQAAAIDTLAKGIDLAPLWALFAEPSIVKVLHSASQDLAVLMQETRTVPRPIFDTQVAAAFCGFGDQVGYAALASEICGATIDKIAQRTDWRVRPLKQQQLDYALGDVAHLGAIYARLRTELESRQRSDWAAEEMERLGNPNIYRIDPREQWRRIRIRRPTPRLNAMLRELAAWRELAANQRDLPKSWLVKDEILIELAHLEPQHMDSLAGVAGLGRRFRSGHYGQQILDAVRRGLDLPNSACPAVTTTSGDVRHKPLLNRLRALLKERSEAHGIVPQLVATRSDLERLAGEDNPDIRALSGWRLTVFGEAALALKHE